MRRSAIEASLSKVIDAHRINLVFGPAGVGKSTLLASTMASLKGWETLRVSLGAEVVDRARVYQSIAVELLRAGGKRPGLDAAYFSGSHNLEASLSKLFFEQIVTHEPGKGPLLLVFDDVDAVLKSGAGKGVSGVLRTWGQNADRDDAPGKEEGWARLHLVLVSQVGPWLKLHEVDYGLNSAKLFEVGDLSLSELLELVEAYAPRGWYAQPQALAPLTALIGAHPGLWSIVLGHARDTGVGVAELASETQQRRGPLRQHLQGLQQTLRADPALQRSFDRAAREPVDLPAESFGALAALGLVKPLNRGKQLLATLRYPLYRVLVSVLDEGEGGEYTCRRRAFASGSGVSCAPPTCTSPARSTTSSSSSWPSRTSFARSSGRPNAAKPA